MPRNNCNRRYRNIVFTWNNYTLEEYYYILESDIWTYVIVAKEICPDTGTPHLQGYGELLKQTGHNKLVELGNRRLGYPGDQAWG